MGTHGLLAPNTSHATYDAVAEASRYLQKVFGTFIRNPSNGLKHVFGWPTFAPGHRTLVELFTNNTISAALRVPDEDGMCKNAPPFPYLEMLKGPPEC
jgi:hypothetical protein